MRLFPIMVVLCVHAGLASAAEKADPRAVEYCVGLDTNFVAVEKCLPDVHVAYAVIDAVAEIYGDAGIELRDRCLEVNKGKVTGAEACISTAIDAAVKLAEKIPEGTQIPDQLFGALQDSAKQAALLNVELSAREVFPDKRFWGGGTYRPLR